jgi:hypothetical protein
VWGEFVQAWATPCYVGGILAFYTKAVSVKVWFVCSLATRFTVGEVVFWCSWFICLCLLLIHLPSPWRLAMLPGTVCIAFFFKPIF